jgi:hypothetical protein
LAHHYAEALQTERAIEHWLRQASAARNARPISKPSVI